MPGARHVERLWVPPWWWLLAAGAVATVWLALAGALGAPVAGAAAGLTAVLVGAALVRYGALTVGVDAAGFRAGPAVLPLWAVGDVEALRGERARAARGPEAGPMDHLVLRGYVDGVVRVVVSDPDDPVERWIVSSRRPEDLAAALVAARGGAST